MNNKEFFIGWSENSAPQSISWIRKHILLIGILLVILVGICALFQSMIGKGFFDFGNIQNFEGVFVKSPVPMLVSKDGIEGYKVLYLVNEFKYGIDKEQADSFHLKHVQINGTFIHDQKQGMIEISKDGIELSQEKNFDSHDIPSFSAQGTIEVTGEIMDSKCWLGVMNPGSRKTHRACAILCIKGGIPPIVVGTETGQSNYDYYLLVGPDGAPVNNFIINYVGFPIKISGELEVAGDLKIIKMDPDSLDRVH